MRFFLVYLATVPVFDVLKKGENMQRLLSRFMVLLLLVTTGCLLYASPKKADSCWETALSKWDSCDSGYTATVIRWDTTTHTTTCTSQAEGICHTSNHSVACFVSQFDSCQSALNNEWDSRATTYGDCLGADGNANNCLADVEFDCGAAEARNESSAAQYDGSDNLGARLDCRAASGVDSCQ